MTLAKSMENFQTVFKYAWLLTKFCLKGSGGGGGGGGGEGEHREWWNQQPTTGLIHT